MTIIEVDNLGKKYILTHQRKEPYIALRDVIVEKVKAVARKSGSLFSPVTSHLTPYNNREEFWALKNVSFEVKQGDRVGIIGRNGAGKSTLLKILSRITEPTQGRVRIRGRVASLLEVGTGFHPELTGRENIFLNGAILGMTKAEIKRKFDEIVAFAEVEMFLDTPVKHYSSGMYVRLAFAVAAHLEPEILVIDEVLAVGDAQFQKKCLGKMEDVSTKEGRTVLFVSHNMEAIKSLCSTAIWLKSGAICGHGDVSEQIDLYLMAGQMPVQIAANNVVVLDANLELRRFEFSPNPVASGNEQEFVIELWSPKTMRLHAVTVLFYSVLGVRVAILDLRRPGAPYYLDGMTSLTIKGKIAAMQLVEGDYHVGLYLDYGEARDNFFNLVNIAVTGKESSNDIVPYPANVRGFVDLNFYIDP